LAPLLLDTSVLIDPRPIRESGLTAISVVSIAELHFGVLGSTDQAARAQRTIRLGTIEARFSPLPIDSRVAREWGRLQACVKSRGGDPRARGNGLILAATAIVHKATLLTLNVNDLRLVSDLVDVREPRYDDPKAQAERPN